MSETNSEQNGTEPEDPKPTPKAEDPKPNPKADATWSENISLKEAWPFVLVVITAAITFVTTKFMIEGRVARLESEHSRRLETLEKQIAPSDQVIVFNQRKELFYQINALRLIETEMVGLESFLKNWKKPVPKYSKKPSFLPPDASPFEKEIAYEADFQGNSPILEYDARLFRTVILSPTFFTINDKNFVSDVAQLNRSLDRYNTLMAPNVGSTIPTLSGFLLVGLPKEEVESRLTQAEQEILQMRGLISNMSHRAESLRQEIEKTASTSRR